jgi:hypothetical protein
MTKGISATSTVIREDRYSELDLAKVLTEAMEWAEQRDAELGRHWSAVYPWRT